MSKLSCGLLVLALLTGCVSVSKKQRNAVSQFAGKTLFFSSLPEKIVIELSLIREERGIYYANSFVDPALHLRELDGVVKEGQTEVKIVKQIGSSFIILERYATGLSLLTSDHPVKATSSSYGKIGIQLETLVNQYNLVNQGIRIPTGIGTLLTGVMEIGSRRFLQARQVRELRKLVVQADTLVNVLCNEMVTILSSADFEKLISNEETGITEAFRFYFTKRSQPELSGDHSYVALKKRIAAVRQLKQQTITAAVAMKSAHRRLSEELSKKPSVGVVATEIDDFYKDVENLEARVKVLEKL